MTIAQQKLRTERLTKLFQSIVDGKRTKGKLYTLMYNKVK
jgi:hypothetical protein